MTSDRGAPAMGGEPNAPNVPGVSGLRAIALAAVAEACGVAVAPGIPGTVAAGAAGAATPEHAYLREAHARVMRSRGDWIIALEDARDRPAAEDRDLWRAGLALGLSASELLTIALAAAVEDDPMTGRALAQVQAPVGGSRPTVGLLARALDRAARIVDGMSAHGGLVPPAAHGGPVRPAAHGSGLVIEMLAGGAARRTGFVQLAPAGAPLSERMVVVPEHIASALRGGSVCMDGATIGPDIAPIPMPASMDREVDLHAHALMATRRAGLVVRTSSRLEGSTVAAALARALDLEPVFLRGALWSNMASSMAPGLASSMALGMAPWQTPGLAPWLLLRRLLPVVCLDLAPGERHELAPIEGYHGPILVLCGVDGHVASISHTLASWHIPIPPRAERVALWQAALGPGDASLAASLGSEHRHGAGRIAQLGRAVRYRAAMDQRDAPARGDVVSAAWTVEGGGLDAMATPVPERVGDDALILPPASSRQLEALLARCQLRDGIQDGLGTALGTRYRPGVCALFVGRSGTGKTLAASWLATRLGMPLYRVDLASVLSKYIGETEKNLARLLAQAEQSEIMLLFDEADSLFGKRTEVQQANDRFANTQTNYLLQRIEGYDGIAILTGNSRTRFDAAFTRRLDMILEFDPPAPAERRRLWQAHLGADHGVRPRELSRIAAAADLCGGHIRNVVLTAAVQARRDGRGIDYGDLLLGLELEYRKQGRQLPAVLAAEAEARASRRSAGGAGAADPAGER